MSFNFNFSQPKPAAAPAASTSTAPSFSFSAAPPNPAPQNNAGVGSSPFSFGQASASTPAATGGGLFGNAGQAQPQPQAQQGQAGQSTGMFNFGSKPGTAPGATSTTSGGMFGGSLFGGQHQQQQLPATTQQVGQSSIFGQPAQPQSTSLFAQPNAQASTNNLFGQQSQQQTASGHGLFGSHSTSQPQPGLQASTSTSPSGLSKTTKFSDLPEAHQKVVEQMDAWIKQQKEAGSGMNVESLGQAIWQTAGDVKAATEEYSALSQGLVSLETSLLQLRTKFIAEEEDLRKVAEIWETYRSVDGRPGAVRVAAHRDFPQDFFSRMTVGMEERVARYKKTISQLNRAVTSLSADQEGPSQQAVAQTIQNHQNALINLAAHLEGLQLRMNDLRSAFAQDFRDRTDSMRDPFEMAREEKGLTQIRV